MKTCSKCKSLKSEESFSLCNKSKSRLQSQCKDCKSLGAKGRKKTIRYIYKKSKSSRLKAYYKDRIHHNIARLLRRGLKNNKDGNTFSLLGYTQQELKDHLESLFLLGMTWNNYGKGSGRWHIDHIIPRSLLIYTHSSDDNFKKCWTLSNLQPLWEEDNLKKSNKIW